MRFDIYGRFHVEIRREKGDWVAYRSELGKRSRMSDLILPSDLEEGEIAIYLDDIFHEYAGPGQCVGRIAD